MSELDRKQLERKLREHPLVAPRLKHARDMHAADAAVMECIYGEPITVQSWLRSSTREQVKLAFSQIERDETYRDCLADVQSIKNCFDGNHCRDPQLAKQQLMDLKAKWEGLIQKHKGTMLGDRVSEAFTRLPNASTKPDGKWLSHLYDTGGDFRFSLGHQPTSQE
jgi:hypothetical protein